MKKQRREKRFISMFMALAMALSIVSYYGVSKSEKKGRVEAANIYESEVSKRIDYLNNVLGGKVFGVNNNTGCGYKSDNPTHNKYLCSNCINSNVVNASWFKELFGSISYTQFPEHFTPSGGITRNADSCAGFANFAEWYIFKSSNSDTVNTYKVGTGTFSYDYVSSNARIGDILRLDNDHSVIYISCNSSGINVLDCNWTEGGTLPNSYVQKHSILYSIYNTVTISRVDVNVVSGNAINYPKITDPSFICYFVSPNGWYLYDDNDLISIPFSEYEKTKYAWKCTKQSDGSYTIASYTSGWLFDDANAGTANRNNIGLWKPNGSSAQKYNIYNLGNNKVVMEPLCATGSVIDNGGEAVGSGRNVHLYNYIENNDFQIFTIVKLTEPIINTCRTHTWDSGVVTTSASCGINGSKKYTCTVCGSTKTEEIPSTGNHVWDDGVITTQVTCAENGEKTYTCSECGAIKTEEIPALEHSYDSGTVIQEGTRFSPKVIEYVCSNCGDTKTEQISDNETIWTDSIELDKASVELGEEDTVKLTATVLPEDAKDKSVIWSSADSSIATVDEEGNVIAVAEGETTIRATAKDSILPTKEYRSRSIIDYETETTTEKDSLGSDWEYVSEKTNTEYSDWGAWSNWSKTEYTASDTREVEVRNIAATYKTQYNYSKYAQYSDGTGWSGPSAGYWSGYYCQYLINRGWSDSALSAYDSDGSIILYGRSGDTWYNQTTRQVEKTAAYKEYRYRDRTKTVTTTYTYKKPVWSDWSEWSAVPVEEADDIQVEEREVQNGGEGTVFAECTVKVVKEHKVHTWDNGTIIKDATCQEKGTIRYSCLYCEETRDEEIPLAEHTIVTDKAVSPTCAKTGLTEGSHCSVCNEVIVAQKSIDKLEHDYTDWTIIQGVYPESLLLSDLEAAHIIVSRSCKNCTHNEVHEHEWKIDSDGYTKPTCERQGTGIAVCEICGASRIVTEPATGHKIVKDKAVAATCAENGCTEGSHCSVCEKVLEAQEVITATGHDFTDWEQDGENEDSYIRTCKTCGTVEREVHRWDDGTITKEASCTEDGLIEYHCQDCSKVKKVTIKAYGHTEVTDLAVEATCTEDGKTEGKHCSTCGAVLVKQTVVKTTGHKYSDWTYDNTDEAEIYTRCCEKCNHVEERRTNHVYGDPVMTTKPTCSAPGVLTYTCEDCGRTREEVIKPLAHKPVTDVAVNPTDDKDGLTEGSHCSVCGDTIVKQEVIPALGHSYGEPVWTWTGTTKAVAIFTCKNNTSHVETKEATITSNVTTPATCETKGVRTYTATVKLDGKTYTSTKKTSIAAKGHSYGEPTWKWTGTTKAVATFTCKNGCGHKETATATIAGKITAVATCDKAGSRTYTATVTFKGKTYTTTKKASIAATGHNYGVPTWTWTGTTKAVAVFTCGYDDSHVKKVTATITSKVTQKATITTAGTKTFTATAVFDGVTYKKSKTAKYYLFDKSKTGLQKYNDKLYYTKNGVLYASFTGFAKYGTNWYYANKGKVSTTKTAIIKGKVNGTTASWYVKNGKVMLTYSGTVKIGTKSYKIKKGKVVG